MYGKANFLLMGSPRFGDPANVAFLWQQLPPESNEDAPELIEPEADKESVSNFMQHLYSCDLPLENAVQLDRHLSSDGFVVPSLGTEHRHGQLSPDWSRDTAAVLPQQTRSARSRRRSSSRERPTRRQSGSRSEYSSTRSDGRREYSRQQSDSRSKCSRQHSDNRTEYSRQHSDNRTEYSRQYSNNRTEYSRQHSDNRTEYSRQHSDNRTEYSRQHSDNRTEYSRQHSDNRTEYSRQHSDNRTEYSRQHSDNRTEYSRQHSDNRSEYSRHYSSSRNGRWSRRSDSTERHSDRKRCADRPSATENGVCEKYSCRDSGAAAAPAREAAPLFGVRSSSNLRQMPEAPTAEAPKPKADVKRYYSICSVCDVVLNSEQCLKDHILGKKHQAAMKVSPKAASARGNSQDENYCFCASCRVQVRADALEAHLGSTAHAASLALAGANMLQLMRPA